MIKLVQRDSDGVIIDIETLPDRIIVIDGGEYIVDYKRPSDAREAVRENAQLMAYALGLDYGLIEARIVEHIGTLDAGMSPVDLGTALHKKLERDITINKYLDGFVRACDTPGRGHGKRRKARDWDQRSRKHHGR